MFNSYADIFNKRGAAYHRAMQQFPTARDEEFRTIIGLLEPASGQTIVDMPSGGGYLRGYLGNAVKLIAIETTQAFYEQCEEDEQTQSMLCALDDTGLPANSVEAVVSMAGLHHVEDRVAVFDEVHRILKPGGRFCIADVETGSPVDGFLNGFVHTHNSMGHEGRFIDTHFRDCLLQSGFELEFDELIKYPWKFADKQQMITYCTLMFGLDLAAPQQVLEGITAYQNYSNGQGGCAMNWELLFIRCRK